MELLYIYIPEFRNFKEQAFNFSSEYHFFTEPSNTEISITIKRNSQFIENFFDCPQIINITAVLGQNGTGKSNILEFIKNEFPHGQGGIKHRLIVGVREELDGEKLFTLYYTQALQVKVIDETQLFRKKVLRNEKVTSGGITVESFDEIESFSNASIVYYSNSFDPKFTSSLDSLNFQYDWLHSVESYYLNISTLGLLNSDKENFAHDYGLSVERLDAYKNRELGRNLEFIASDFSRQIEYKFPDHLLINRIKEDEEQLRSLHSRSKVVMALDKYQSELNAPKIDGQTFINQICRVILLDFLYEDQSDQIEFESFSKDYPTNFFNAFRNYFISYKKGTSSKIYRAKKIVELVDFLTEHLIKDYSSFVPRGDNVGVIVLPVIKEGKKNIQEFLNLYVAAKGQTDFLTFQWVGLSSGEQSMLTLLSRFYKLSDDQAPENLKLKDSLIILIDEGDVYFHPEWQRKYLQMLLDFLPKIFPQKNIQLILTANTPYLASDLTKSHIIFIKKDDNKSIVLGPDNDRKETFAANIHLLLANSFFLKGGLLGQFAESKVNSIIDFIKNDSRNNDSFKKIKKEIDVIGEPVIKGRLKELWIEGFGVDEEIEALKQRIAILEAESRRKKSKK